MKISLISTATKPPVTTYFSSRGSCFFGQRHHHIVVTSSSSTKKSIRRNDSNYYTSVVVDMRAETKGGEVVESTTSVEIESGSGYTTTSTSTSGISAMEVTSFNQGLINDASEFPVWDKIGAIVRLGYGIGIYGAMGLTGRFICSISGIDSMGGFDPTLDAIVEGLGYAAPPIMALLFILDDEVVKLSPYARAIRDVEDEELRSFFYGMSPLQFMLIVAASSVGEELFYRAAVQGALADIFLRSSDFVADARGMAALTGVLPPFVPFAQAFAAVITAALTGSLYYMAASPKDPTYIVAPVLKSRSGHEELKKLISAWYEKRELKKIYSPMLEAFLALYLGFEWNQTNNILAPIITHGIYSSVILGHRLWKIQDHQRKLRQRVQKLKVERNVSKKL